MLIQTVLSDRVKGARVRTAAQLRFAEHSNAFGFLRLFFASLVIVSHTPELIDGNRSREILTGIFHTISFGEFAVDAFFIISGFLITASFLSSRSPYAYLRKRIARIYPAFVVSSAFCLLAVGPLAGGYSELGTIGGLIEAIVRVVVLCPPAMQHVFAGTLNNVLNGAAWTIQYEFLCYLIVLILGVTGWLRSPGLLAFMSLVCLSVAGFASATVGPYLNAPSFQQLFLLGDRIALMRLTGLFLAGATFYHLQEILRFSKSSIVLALSMLCGSLFIPALAHLGVAIFGAYVIFAVAALGAGSWLAHINNGNDISYGVYLYAWPIEKLLLWWRVFDNPVEIGLATLLLSAGAGALSWFFVEKPVMAMARSANTAPAESISNGREPRGELPRLASKGPP